MLYTNLLSRLDITFYINAIEPNNSSSHHMGYTGKDVIRNMMIQPSHELNEILDRQFDYRFDTVCDQKVKLNLKELILWMRLPRNAVSCGSVNSASPDNRRYRRIEICYGSLKETQWTSEVYFGFYGHILKDKNGDYRMDAYQHVEVLPNHSFPVLVGEPIRMESNSLNGFGENVLRALVKSSLRKEIGRTLKTKTDVSGIYIDDATYCSMLSLGLVEEIAAILNKFEEVNDVTWCVTHRKLSGVLAKKLKELINLYLKVFGYHIRRAKCKDLVVPQPPELKNMMLGRLVNSLNRFAATKLNEY